MWLPRSRWGKTACLDSKELPTREITYIVLIRANCVFMVAQLYLRNQLLFILAAIIDRILVYDMCVCVRVCVCVCLLLAMPNLAAARLMGDIFARP